MPGRRTRRVIETSWVVWRGTSNWVRKLPGVEVEQGQASKSFTSLGAAISSERERASYDRGKKRGHLPAVGWKLNNPPWHDCECCVSIDMGASLRLTQSLRNWPKY